MQPGQVSRLAKGTGNPRALSTYMGYFCCDPDTTAEKPVFNRSVTLKDSWAKIERKEGK